MIMVFDILIFQLTENRMVGLLRTVVSVRPTFVHDGGGHTNHGHWDQIKPLNMFRQTAFANKCKNRVVQII